MAGLVRRLPLVSPAAWPLATALVAILTALSAACTVVDTPRAGARHIPPTQPVDQYATFVRTQSSDEWVSKTFSLQQRYSRVLVVCNDGPVPQFIRAAAPDLNARPGANPNPEIDYPVHQVFTSPQAAWDAARGGDLIAIMPGRYESSAGLVLGDRPDTGEGKYIHFKAMGQPGAVVIKKFDYQERHRSFTITVLGSYVILEGLAIEGSATPERLTGTAAGILVAGDFPVTGQFSHHVAVLNCLSRSHWKWGMHAVACHSLLVQDCLFSEARAQHGLYVSNGSDNCVIRRNVFANNTRCGLQCNMDTSACIGVLTMHPDMAAFAMKDPEDESNGPGGRAPDAIASMIGPGPGQWVQGGLGGRPRLLQVLAAADRRFGPGGYPDGLGVNYIIEENVVCSNGRRGGAAFNLAGLRQSLIQNNLVYDNGNHGIALYDDSDFGFDHTLVQNPATRAAFTGAEVLPRYGSCDNIVRNNTVLLDDPEWFALAAINGSYGNKIRNNILINQRGDSVHVTSASIWHHDSGYNVVQANRYVTYNETGSGVPYDLPPMPEDVRSLATAIDENNHSALRVNLTTIGAQFVRCGQEPWVVLEGGWWKLNPQRPDFRPRIGADLLAGQGDASELPPTDLAGRKRSAADIGAFAAPQ